MYSTLTDNVFAAGKADQMEARRPPYVQGQGCRMIRDLVEGIYKDPRRLGPVSLQLALCRG